MRYKGDLHITESHIDSHRIDEVETLRFAADLLSRHMLDLCNQESENGYDTGWLAGVAQTVSDLCEMAYQREEERKKEENSKQPQA